MKISRLKVIACYLIVFCSIATLANERPAGLQEALDDARQARLMYLDKLERIKVARQKTQAMQKEIAYSLQAINDMKKKINLQKRVEREFDEYSLADHQFMMLHQIFGALKKIAEQHGRHHPTAHYYTLGRKRHLQDKADAFEQSIPDTSISFMAKYRQGMKLLIEEWQKTHTTEIYTDTIDGEKIDIARIGNLFWVMNLPRFDGYIAMSGITTVSSDETRQLKRQVASTIERLEQSTTEQFLILPYQPVAPPKDSSGPW